MGKSLRVRTQAETLDYLNGSFADLGKAIDAIGEKNAAVSRNVIRRPLNGILGNEGRSSGRIVDHSDQNPARK
jgi:hypothetical protein